MAARPRATDPGWWYRCKDLVAHRVAAANQLRAHLAVAFPAAVRLFSELDGPLSRAFLARFGSQDAAAGLDEDAMADWQGERLGVVDVIGIPQHWYAGRSLAYVPLFETSEDRLMPQTRSHNSPWG